MKLIQVVGIIDFISFVAYLLFDAPKLLWATYKQLTHRWYSGRHIAIAGLAEPVQLVWPWLEQ